MRRADLLGAPFAHPDVEDLAGADQIGRISGLPVPRYVSLKSDRVNLREGPSKDRRTVWIYERAGLPVEITAEFETWRKVRDSEGSEGWVYHSLLSGRRSALVTLKVKDELITIHDGPDAKSAVVAQLENGVLASLKSCNGSWCRVAGKNFDGWIRQERVWGAYPNEKLD